MHILVTGGAGYVGSCLVPVLLTEGHHVRVLDVLRRGARSLLPCCAHPRFEFLPGDVMDEELLSSALQDMDAVVHLAAVVGQVACTREPGCAWHTNVEGTRRLLSCRRPDQRFLLASTANVYGAVPGGTCSEDTAVGPQTLYGRSKAAAEELVLRSGNAVVFRFATGFGVSPGMRFDLLVNDFVYQSIRRGNVVLYESGARRALVHVRDMVRSVAFALGSWSALVDDVYNIGNEAINLSKAEIADCIGRQVDCQFHFAEFDSDADRRDYVMSCQKIRARGFEAEVGLDTGIAELVKAARLVD